MEQPEITTDILQVEETRYLLKSPGFVAFLSTLVMGLGQFFNGQLKKAVVFFAAEVGVALYVWDYFGPRVVSDALMGLLPHGVYGTFLALLAISGVALWIFNIRDAYQMARFMDFIFDRSNPTLDSDEQEFLQASLSVTRLGFRVHRGVTRKALFVGVAMLVYSVVLLVVGGRMSADNAELQLKSFVAAHPDNARAHLQLGEILLAKGVPKAAQTELEKARLLAKDQKDTRTLYRSQTSLARVLSDLGANEQANAMLQEALALTASSAATSVASSTSAVPGTQRASDDRTLPDASPSTVATLPSPIDTPDQENRSEAVSASSPRSTRDTARASREADTRAAPAEDSSNAKTRELLITARFGAARDSDGAPEETASSRETPPSPTSSPSISSEASTPRQPETDQPASSPSVPAQSDEASVLLSRALSNLKVKNYGEAGRLLAAVLRKGPPSGAYHAVAGRLKAALCEWADCATELEAALEQGPVDPDLRLMLAEAKLKTGRTEDAVRHLKAGLQARPHDPHAVLMLAEIHRKAGQRSEASKLVNEALLVNPDHPGLLACNYRVALDTSNEELAFQTALTILKGPEQDIDRTRSLVTSALDARQFGLAHRLADVCIQRKPQEALGHILKGTVLVRQNKARQAVSCFEKAAGLERNEPELFYEIALFYRRLGKSKRAVESLRRAIDLNPSSATYTRELGSVLFAMGEFDQARIAYQKAVKQAPGDVLNIVGLGESHLRLGQTAEAKAAFERALQIEPKNEAARRFLAVAESKHQPEQALARNGHADEAVVGAHLISEKETPTPPKKLNTVAAKDREDSSDENEGEQGPETYESPASSRARATGEEASEGTEANRTAAEDRVRKAGLAFRAGDFRATEKFCRELLAENPNHAQAHYRLGLIHKARKQIREAVAELEIARRCDPRNASALLELGQLYTESNQTSLAIERLESLLKIEPSSLAGHYSLGVNYERAKVYSRAEAEYQTILRLYPEFRDGHDYLGNLYFTQRRFKLASAEYEKLARVKPHDPKPRFKMAVALYHQNDIPRARQEFQALRRTLPQEDPLQAKVNGYLARL